MSLHVNPVQIGNHQVGPNEPTFIVAEIGINHNGFVSIAKQLIDLAIDAGCDAVKFQTRTVPIVYSAEELDKPRDVPQDILENAVSRNVLPKESVQRLKRSRFLDTKNGDLKYALELTDSEYREIDSYCSQRGILWFTSCWDVDSVDRMESLFSLPCHKIASACNEDDLLLARLRATGKPLILSTGMTDLQGVHDAVGVLGRENLIILHCTSVYPQGVGTEYGEEMLRHINLRGMDTLIREFSVPVGFSGHDTGIQPTYAAVVLGACMIEKHITLERGMWGSDQGSSLAPEGLRRLCGMVRELPHVLGSGVIEIYPAEQTAITKLRRVRRKKP